MNRKYLNKKITFSLVILIIILGYFFRLDIEDGLECLAYYDQCTAIRIEGLTEQACHSRKDSVAYLLESGICLVR